MQPLSSAQQSSFESRSIVYTGGKYENERFDYQLLKPEKLESGQKYPLVVFLHGAGERGTDNRLQLKYLPESMAKRPFREQFPCFLLAPQCRAGEQWVDVPWGDKKSTPMAEEPTEQMAAVIQMIESTLRDEPIDRTRIYLTGLSMGGYGAWELAARKPQLFAALAPVCGGGDEQQAERLTMPVWAFHGDRDNAVPVVRSRSMIRALEDAGHEHVKYTELPGVGHNSWIQAYSADSGLLSWMFQQRRGTR